MEDGTSGLNFYGSNKMPLVGIGLDKKYQGFVGIRDVKGNTRIGMNYSDGRGDLLLADENGKLQLSLQDHIVSAMK